MNIKTKYSRRRIAALCGAAVLFVGDIAPVNAYAEQTEQDAVESLAMTLEAPTDGCINKRAGRDDGEIIHRTEYL